MMLIHTHRNRNQTAPRSKEFIEHLKKKTEHNANKQLEQNGNIQKEQKGMIKFP